MLQAIHEELSGRVIRVITRAEILWEHPTYLIAKKNGKLRKGLFATSLDISSAYHHVPVAPRAQPYLSFNYNKHMYSYTAMPFGINTAPRTFTLLMRQCIKAIRERWQVTAIHYLDDLLFLHADPQYLAKATTEIVRFLTYLGWVINTEKSETVPKQLFVYLGWEWDSRVPSVRLPPTRVTAILHDLRAVENAVQAHATSTARKLARLIGSLSATRLQHRQASLHLRALDTFKAASVATRGWDGETQPLTSAMLTEIMWWKQTISANEPRLLGIPPPQLSLFTDASPIGWGAHCLLIGQTDEMWMHGTWAKKATSNALECQAVEQALRRLRQTPEASAISSVLVRSDNTATCYNINRQAACDTLVPALSSLLRFAERANLHLTAEHISGVNNSIADRLSRISPGGDYALRPQVLQQLLRSWGVQIGADLFAAGWNAQHPCYFSTSSDRNALGRNAFNVRWNQFTLPLLHPPLPLLPKVLRRLEQEKMTAILIAPLWSRQPWSELLRSMTVRMQDLGPTERVLVQGRRMAR
jgi:ribonuclease HI